MFSSTFSISSIPNHIIASLSTAEVEAAVRIIKDSLLEDIGSGDITTLSTISPSSQSTATFLAKDKGIISGLNIAELVFFIINPSLIVKWLVNNGEEVQAGTILGRINGNTQSLLMGERVSLNLLQRMSGIASMTRVMIERIESVGSSSKLLDTRKTVPGMRLLDKLSVRHGGGVNHRIGLFDMIMIKDNHIKASGSITNALTQVRKYLIDHSLTVPIEVEVRTIEELKELLSVGHNKNEQPVQRIMLDNTVEVTYDANKRLSINTNKLKEWLDLINNSGFSYESEASGNVTIDTIGEIAKTNVTYISTGSITHSVKAMDISMKIN